MRGSPRDALTRESRRDHRGSDPSATVWARVEEGSISCLSVSVERAQGFHRMSSPIAVLPSWARPTDVINIYRGFAAASAMQKLVARPRSDKRRCYVCARGPGFFGCGEIRALAEPLEQLVIDAVLYRPGRELPAEGD
jgi:hypothetical protein